MAFPSPIIKLTVAGDTGSCAATQRVPVNTTVTAAKDSIASNAGYHRGEEDDNDAFERHSVLLPSSIRSLRPRWLPLRTGEATGAETWTGVGVHDGVKPSSKE
jgi:hypothetical protein